MAELGRTGGLASGAARRHRAKSLDQLVAERLEAEADVLVARLRLAIDRGDLNAALVLVSEAMNTSRERVEKEDARREMLERRARSRADGWRRRNDDWLEA